MVILLIAFFLSRQSFDVDGAEAWLQYNGIDPNSMDGQSAYQKEYIRQKLDLPLFYFSIIPSHYHHNINANPDRQQRKIMATLTSQGYNADDVGKLLDLRHKMLSSLSYGTTADSTMALLNFAVNFSDFTALSHALRTDKGLEMEWQTKMQAALQELASKKTTFFIPKFVWHGMRNQWHFWSANLFQGQMGKSIRDGRQVSSKIYDAMRWTLVLLILNLFFTLLFAVPFGVWSGVKAGTWFDRISQAFWMMLYATPVFWLASMLIMYFTSDRYGSWMDIFPTPGLWQIGPEQSIWSFLRQNSVQFILPVICLVANDIAFLSRVVRNNVKDNLQRRYAKVAEAKGLSQLNVLVRHVIPNVLIPLVTIVVAAIPAGLSGGLVIEVIFNIPGVGRLMFESIQAQDWNVVFSILAIISISVTVFLLIGDVLYALVNPKVRVDG